MLIAITITCDFLGRGGGLWGSIGFSYAVCILSKIILKLFKKKKNGGHLKPGNTSYQ